MKMESENEQYVLVMDASREDSLRVIDGVLREFSLKSGDNLTVLAVLHQVNSPMGYRVSVDSDSITGTNERIVEEAIALKQIEYNNNKEVISISKQCEADEIGFEMMVLAGKYDALEQARICQATWVILDKEMKRERKLFLDELTCRMSRMKRDNSFELLRGPKEFSGSKPLAETEGQCKYDEMLPRSPKVHSRSIERSCGPARASSSNEQSQKNTAREKSRREQICKETHDNLVPFQHGPSNLDEEAVRPCSECGNRRPRVAWNKQFTYAELQEATKGFSDKNFLSEGGFGAVYKGELRNGVEIAVKQHKSASEQGQREFEAEVHFLRTATHKNLVRLLGWCNEGSHRLLVYEYICNGSLDVQLSIHRSKPLSWSERMKIATGAANGLLYLHRSKIVHRDIRPNNILLTHDYDALLGDFGLARTQSDKTAETRVVGTLGYLAPEYAESGKVSTKTDVYALGVILLQLITGRATNDKSLNGQSLVGWARPLLKDKNYPGLIDPRIMDNHDFHQLFWMVRVAEKCLIKDPHRRLPVDKVVHALKYMREANPICQLKLSPDNSACSSPRSSLDSPETEDDDDDHALPTKEANKGTPWIIDYDETARLSQSSSSHGSSSGRSSMSTASD